MATIKEIAVKNNVSTATVSRVLNHDTRLQVSEEVRENILKTAKELGYLTPRNRKKQESDQLYIAIVFWFQKDQKVNEVYYNQIRKGIENSSIKSNIRTKVFYNDNFLFKRSTFEGVDGIIAVGKFGTKTIKLFESCTENIVFIDSSPDILKFNSVVIDFRNAIDQVIKVLLIKGYQKIGYLGGVEYIDDQTKLGERRGIVFRELLQKRDMFYPEHMHLGKFTSESGYNLMKMAIQNNNLAQVYFCGDDSICLGALKALHEAGLNVPHDVGLIGFGDAPTSEFVHPSLASVHVYTEMIGEQALISLQEQLKGRFVPVRKVIPTYVKDRNSLL